MFKKNLLKIARRGNLDYDKKENRARIGYLAGIVGLVANIFLTLIKAFIGISISSIAVLADAFNNLSDAISSIVTIVGFNISNSPPDKEHPYGHGRVEYLAALIISFLIILVGFQFVKSSISRIRDPKVLEFTLPSFILLIISVIIKLCLYVFNKSLAKKIESNALRATALDALVDLIISLVIILSLLMPFISDFPLDGYIGLVVSIIILYSGFTLVKETLSPLIGEAASSETIKALKEDIVKYDHILACHDLMIHKYGPGRKIASIDVEVDASLSLVKIHNIVDRAERELGKKHNLHLVIHVDPLGHESKEIKKAKKELMEKIKDHELIKSIHDFNIVEENQKKCLICHFVLDGNKINKKLKKEKLKKELREIIREIDPYLDCDLIIDIEYD